MNKKILPWVITFCAIGLGGTAAYYSIIGLSKLFAGVATAVIIMASFLEISKLTLATLLHSYWKELSKISKIYYTVSIIILSLITSAGIYGMLSSGYQEISNKLSNTESQISLIETKRDNLKEQLISYNLEKETSNKSITDLRAGLSNNIIQYKDKKGDIITTTSSSTRNSLEKQLDQAISRQNIINSKIDELNSQLFEYETQIIEIKTNDDIASEIGPLKYLSKLLGVSMDEIINIFLLVIIFVFDPLAISLVVAANFSFAQLSTSKPIIVKPPTITKPSTPKTRKNFKKKPKKIKKDLTIPESNSLYHALDTPIPNLNNIEEIKNEIESLESQLLDPSISSWKQNKLKNQVSNLKLQIAENNDDKIY
jgi:hypothetical protein